MKQNRRNERSAVTKSFVALADTAVDSFSTASVTSLARKQDHLLTAARSDGLHQAAAGPELGCQRRGDLRERGRDQDGIAGAPSGSLRSPASTCVAHRGA